ncbi:hypothetical protein KSP40_PGU004633 [Platanthera guangdongensis]|uniref:Uncharacterized protein n=1 Tax=Platanthera guangdongensis TaxID=2320717 RepID=A0ABR2LLQ1_9ASPA
MNFRSYNYPPKNSSCKFGLVITFHASNWATDHTTVNELEIRSWRMKGFTFLRRIARIDSLSEVENELLRLRSEAWFPSTVVLPTEPLFAGDAEDEEQQRDLALALLLAMAKADLETKRMHWEETIHVLRASISETWNRRRDDKQGVCGF